MVLRMNTVCRFKEGGLGKKEGGSVFEGGWYPNAYYVVKASWKKRVYSKNML